MPKADFFHTTRRLFLQRAPAAVAAVALPAAAVAAPEPKFDLQAWLDTAPDQEVADWHAHQIEAILRRSPLNPDSLFTVNVQINKGIAVVVGRG